MQIDQNLSNFSDIAVQTAFVVYCVALFMWLFYYGRMQGIIEGCRAVKSEAAKVLVGAGAGGVDKQSYAGEVAQSSSGITADELKEKERKADKLGGMTSALMWVGIALHAAAIVLRGLATGRFPFGNLYEYVLMVSFGVLLVGNIAMQRKEWRTVWPWLLTPTLALMFYGSTKLYAESAPVVPALQSHWLPIHVLSLIHIWILYAAYLHARATPAFRKAAPWINVMAMALMVFNLFFINMVVSGLHSYAGLN